MAAAKRRAGASSGPTWQRPLFGDDGDPALDQLRRSRHDEQAVAILLDLRPLVGMVGVLDSEIVQVELLLHAAEQRQIRLVQSQTTCPGLLRQFKASSIAILATRRPST